MPRIHFMMLFTSVLQLQLPLSSLAHPNTTPIKRCTTFDICWPSLDTWNKFNQTINGRLIASRPTAAVCHAPTFDEAACIAARNNWTSSPWRTGQVGGYSAILWEVGDGNCGIGNLNGTTVSGEGCEQGRVAQYSVDARSVDDIQKAVQFAAEKELYLVIKNTGHDHLGRSSGEGSFAIWTHHLKGREFHSAFVPKGAPKSIVGTPAVTLQAGEQWIDVYRDAAAHNVTVVGGSARTVGAAGGYLTGGGHSPFAHFYGLAADNLLEAQVIAPTGELKVLNQFTDPHHFWALRGGGGSSWGVITQVTYKTHPLPTHIQVVAVQFNLTSPAARRELLTRSLAAIPAVVNAGYIGYVDTSLGFQAIFSRSNGTNETMLAGFEGFNHLLKLEGVSGVILPMEFPNWLAYSELFLTDPNIATNIIDGSRLLTADVLQNRGSQLVDLIEKYPELGPGFNFVGKVDPAERNNTAVHPIWAKSNALFSFGANWKDDAPKAEKRRMKQLLIGATKDLHALVGPEAGTYMNEANPYEPYWQEVFWGCNYERLLKIKKRIDPQNLMVCNRCVGSDIILEP